MKKMIALISGVPSVGKSNLIRDAPVDTLAIEMEAAPDMPYSFEQVPGLREKWELFLGGDETPFIAALNSVPARRMLLEWGFPMNQLPIIKRFAANGIATWWLEGDHGAARIKHGEAKKSAGAFDDQMRAIRADRAELEEIFKDRKILRLNSQGQFLPNSQVFSTIFGGKTPLG